MSHHKTLIVGAGAMGLVSGYYLQRGGSEVSYLVRPGRTEAFRAPRRLYCYDDGELKTFDGYAVFDQVEAVRDQAFDHVIVTFDGATARSESGSKVLADLGRCLSPERSTIIIGGVGIGLREHCLRMTTWPAHRLLMGTLALLSHQVGAKLPVHPPTDANVLAQASIAYRHISGSLSFFIDGSFPEAAQNFAQRYNQCGVSSCRVLNPSLFAILSNAAFPMLAAGEIAGWPDIDGLVRHRALWRLCCQAQREITRLPPHGWIGRGLALMSTPRLVAGLHRRVERNAWPLDYQAFNRFHHGGKVQAQDMEVMQNCLAEGLRAGRSMPALAELLRQLAQHRVHGIPLPAMSSPGEA